MKALICKWRPPQVPVEGQFSPDVVLTRRSKVNEDSILAVQVFDQKKFKKKDQGFLGVINIRVGDVIELSPESDGTEPAPFPRLGIPFS